MHDASIPSNITVKLVHYQPPKRWFIAILSGIFILVCLVVSAFGGLGSARAVIQGALQGSIDSIGSLAIGLMFVTFSIWSFYSNVWIVETRDEGLYIQYALGNIQIIPWHEMRLIKAMWHRVGGPALHSYTEDSFMSEATISINYFSSPNGKEQVDDLMRVIAEAAHLTRFGRSFLGYPSYQRE